MTRRADRPLFLGGKGGGAKHKSLFEQDGCDIMKAGTHTTLTLWAGAWTAEHTALVRRYKVNSVSVHDPAFGEHKTSDFLLDLPARTERVDHHLDPRRSFRSCAACRAAVAADRLRVGGLAAGRQNTTGRLFRSHETGACRF